MIRRLTFLVRAWLLSRRFFRLSSGFDAIQWFPSYLSSHSISVKAATHYSQPFPLSCGVPHGSVLGPLLPIPYTSPLSHLTTSSSDNLHRYADDSRLFLSFSRDLPQLLYVINLIFKWMFLNLLCLKSAKTEFIIWLTKSDQ